MKFLDAELKPITLRAGLEALTAAFACGLLILGGLSLAGRPLHGSVGVLVGLTVGSLAAAAGISVMKAPKAFGVVVVVLLLLMYVIGAFGG